MSRILRALVSSFWALLMPVLVIAGLMTGVATVNKIGALAVAAQDAAKILIIVAASGAFVWIAARVGLSAELSGLLSGMATNPTVLLGLIALMLLVLGTVLEPVTLLVAVAPVIAPVAVLAGIDVVRLGVVLILASSIWLVTPPVGILLFVTAAQAGVPLRHVVRESLIFLFALCLLLAAIVVWPTLTLGLGAFLEK
jgi:TRAP-type C4-dicarboxylate transport system permease large subunit